MRNRFPGKEKNEQNIEDIPVASSEKKHDDNKGLISFLTQPQDPANLGIFRIFFGNYYQLLTYLYLPIPIYTYLYLPTCLNNKGI